MNKPDNEADLPLLTIAEEADAAVAEKANELGADLCTIERACRAIGFKANGKAERIAVAIAQVGGETQKPMNATVARVASDTQVRCATQYARECLDELVDLGVVERHEIPAPPTRKRGKPAAWYALSIRWDFVRRTVAEYGRWEDSVRGATEASELRRYQEGTAKEARRNDEGGEKERRRNDEYLPTYTSSPPNNLKTYDPLSSAGSMEDEEEDQKNMKQGAGDRHRVEADSIANRVASLWASLGYRGDQGSTLWLITAAVECGVLPEHALGDACAAVRSIGPRDPVAYFRSVAADAAGLTRDELKAALSRVRVTPRLPSSRPRASPRRERPKAPPLREPSPTSDRATNEARNQILATLASLEA